MGGSDQQSGDLFSYVDIEARVPARHPLRAIRGIVNEGLVSLDAEFDKLYADTGRDSIPPERLLRAALLQAFFSIRSERLLMEQLNYNLLYRWFVGLGVDDVAWDHSVFSKNRDRLLEADVAAKFLAAVLAHPKVKPLLSDEHFSVDGTLIEAWASMKSFRAKDGSDEPPRPGRNGERNFHNEERSNDTHASTTDPQAKLYKKGKGKEAKLCFMGHALMENRHGSSCRPKRPRRAARPSARRHWNCSTGRLPAHPTNSRWARTRPTTRASSSPTCGRSASHRTRRRRPGV